MNSEELQNLINYINIPAFVLQEDNIIVVNNHFCNFTGYGEEIINKPLLQILHIPVQHKIGQNNLQQHIHYNPISNELQIYSKNREILAVKVIFTPLMYEGSKAVLGQVLPEHSRTDQADKLNKQILLQNTVNPMIIYDEGGNCLDCNNAALEFFESSRNNFKVNYVGKHGENDLPSFDPFFWERGGRLKKKYKINGREKYLKLNFMPGLLNDKRVLIAIGNDISEQIKFQEELYQMRAEPCKYTPSYEKVKKHQSIAMFGQDNFCAASQHSQHEDMLGLALYCICEGIIIIDNQEKITFINPVAQILTGWMQREAVGRQLNQVVVLDDKLLIFGGDKKFSFKKAMTYDETVGFSRCTTLKGKDGTDYEIVLNVSPLLNGEKEVLGSILIFRDISKQKLQENALRERAEQFRKLVENACDILYRIQVRPELKIEYISPAIKDIIGYAPEEFYDNPKLFASIIEEDSYKKIIGTEYNEKDYNKTLILRCCCKNGKCTWIEMRNTSYYDEEGNLKVVQGIARDVTEKQKLEEKLLQLSHHDALTGLYNRTYFEEKIAEISNKDKGIVGLIVCDVDGLKIINDTLGHSRGDKLLMDTAHVIKESFRQCDIVARIGGDEFAIILDDTSKEDVEKATERLKENVEKYNKIEPELSLYLSIGYAVSDALEINLLDIFKEADNRMYREKLVHSHTSHSAILQKLVKTLETRDFLNEGHARRMRVLVVKLAEMLGLSQTCIERLCLLSQFHDIGKVGIPEYILHKPGPLTEKELEIIQRHCEIGYRIALSSVELAPIADYILKHHEWWNGEGYPLGIKGEDIPIECRIIAIVDAFDTMTTPRPYRKTVSYQEAMEELKRCAGSQFDSELVEKFKDLMDQESYSLEFMKENESGFSG